MITVKYERYWNDFARKNEQRTFRDLEDLENWIFGQMEQDYTKQFVMSFPTPGAAKRIGEPGPWRIEFKPKWGGELFWIKQIESEHGIIFSDGTFTAGQKHWSDSVKTWLCHCEERRKEPKFTFAE